MNRVFADTFYFVALLNRNDQHHSKATAAASQLQGEIITSEWVLMELADALAESAVRRFVAPFIRDLNRDPKVEIISANQKWFLAGLDLYEKRNDKGWTLTDCISFVIMNEEGLTDALTGDHHFVQAGFKILLD